MYDVIPDGRFDNGVTHPETKTTYAGSAVTWFVARAGTPTIEVAYMKGTGRMPRIRSFVLSEGQWGIGFDVVHDIGGKALAWENLYKGVG